MKEYNKVIQNSNSRTIEREIEIQTIVSNYGFAPKIINSKITYDKKTDKFMGIIIMENLNEMCIADKYGEDPSKIPKLIWEQIRTILKILYHSEAIEYIDITGYNFIEKNGKVYIIDFGDAIYSKQGKDINWFLKYFLDGHNGWNPDFQ